MLQLTPSAQSHIVRARAERRLVDGQAARFYGSEGKVRLGFAPSAEPGDHAVAIGNLRVLLSSDVADQLENAVIDARERDGREVLFFRGSERATA